MQKSQCGRPAKLTEADKRELVRAITSGKSDTAIQLAQELKDTAKLEISADIVRRVMKEAGLKAASKKKPRLSSEHIYQHLDFALRRQHWTVEDWKHVTWSDETKINRLSSDGRKWAWKGQLVGSQHNMSKARSSLEVEN